SDSIQFLRSRAVLADRNWSLLSVSSVARATELYTLSLHDALPISLSPAVRDGAQRPGDRVSQDHGAGIGTQVPGDLAQGGLVQLDRKSTRLNSSHDQSSYAVFC